MKDDPLISYRRKPASLDLEALESFAEMLRTRVLRGRSFHCRITNDEELQALNLRFRKKDYTTDVLSFPVEEESVDHIGDIALSLSRARSQANDYGHSVENEVRILLLHGVLHLRGLDHETDDGQMARAEATWRKKFGLPNGLIQRAVDSGAAAGRPNRKKL